MIIIHFSKLKLLTITQQQQLNLNKHLVNNVLVMKPMNQIVVAILLLFVKSALIFKNALNVMMDIFFIKINVKFVKTHVKPVRKHQKIVHHVKSVLFNMGTLVNS